MILINHRIRNIVNTKKAKKTEPKFDWMTEFIEISGRSEWSPRGQRRRRAYGQYIKLHKGDSAIRAIKVLKGPTSLESLLRSNDNMKNFTVFFFFCTFASLCAMVHGGGFLSSLRGFPGRRPIGSPTSGLYGGRTYISRPALGSSGGRPIIRPARPTKSHCECINTWVNCCSSGG